MKLRLRYPRLYAALAVTGLVHSVPASAQDLPYCESSITGFGAYRLSTKLHNSLDTNTIADFQVTLERLFSGGAQEIEHLHAQSRAATVVNEAKLVMKLQYMITEGSENYTALAKEVFIDHPGPQYLNNNIGIGAATLEFADNSFRPESVGSAYVTDFYRSNHNPDLAERIFGAWVSNSNFIVVFNSTVDGKSVPYASVKLAADQIAQYVPNLEQQIDQLWNAYQNEQCRRFSAVSNDPDCFLTTAATGCIGLADDCWELETLRGFRDGYLLNSASGTELVQEYYEIGPDIVRQINARNDANEHWLKAYWSGILPTAILVRLGLHQLAEYSYQRLVRRLQGTAVKL